MGRLPLSSVIAPLSVCALLSITSIARADDEPFFMGRVEVGHVLEWIDVGGDATYSQTPAYHGQPARPPLSGSQLGIQRGFASGLSVGVEVRFASVFTWSVFGWDLLAINPEGREVRVGATRMHATSGMHLRMTTAPGMRFDLGDLALYGRIRVSAGMTSVQLEGTTDSGGRLDQEHGTSRWDVGYEMGVLWTAGWVDVGAAFRHHLVGTHGYGLSVVTSFRFV